MSDPRELIKQQYYPLEGAIAPLAELLRINPRMADEIICLAMVMGIHAEERRKKISMETFQALQDMQRSSW